MKIKRLLPMLIASMLVGGSGNLVASDPELIVFDWAGYEDPEFFKGYKEKHGDDPTFVFFGEEEEAFQKLRAGFKADASHPCSQSVVKWREAGLLEAIDTSRIPAWGSLYRQWREMPGFTHNGKTYIVPADWGNTAITYRTDEVPEVDVRSLQVFVNPKYSQRISLPDNVDDIYALGFLATGITDWSEATDADFREASKFIRAAHRNVRAYWADGAELSQLMASREVLIAWAWNETATTMSANGYPVVMKRDTKEGLSSWICGYVNLKNDQGPEDKFYDFINAWLEARTANYLVSAWGYGHANETAMMAIEPEILMSAGFDNIDKFRDRTLFQGPLRAELRERMIAEFEKIKAGF